MYCYCSVHCYCSMHYHSAHRSCSMHSYPVHRYYSVHHNCPGVTGSPPPPLYKPLRQAYRLLTFSLRQAGIPASASLSAAALALARATLKTIPISASRKNSDEPP